MVKTRLLHTIVLLLLLSFGVSVSNSQQTPVTESHIATINKLFRDNNIMAGYVEFDRYGRLQLKGSYQDEKEVDRAFSLAQTVVGIRWVSPVTPEDIKVKEWEKKFGDLFKRSLVVKPEVRTDRGDYKPGPIRNRYALVVGVGKFRETKITRLEFAVSDARSFYNFLTDPRRGGFNRQDVAFLADEYATKANIAREMERIKQTAMPDDLVVVYISSHGSPPDKRGAVNLVTYDTEVNPREKIWWTSINEEMLKDFVENVRAMRLVMILDTCYSNGAYRAVPGFLPPGGKSLGLGDEEGHGITNEYGKRLLGAKDLVIEDAPKKAGDKPMNLMPDEDGWGKVLISASGAGERSWESDKLRQSIFTYYFIDGLNKNQGSVKNAFNYSKPLVIQRVKQEKGYDIDQTPQVISTSQYWDMRLSQSKRN